MSRHQTLHLENGAVLPKSTASWVNIQKVWVVPLGVLRLFSSDGGEQWVPRLRKDSLLDLQLHMSKECSQWKVHMQKLLDLEPNPTAFPTATDKNLSWAEIAAAMTTVSARRRNTEEEQATSSGSEGKTSTSKISPHVRAGGAVEDDNSSNVDEAGAPRPSWASVSVAPPSEMVPSVRRWLVLKRREATPQSSTSCQTSTLTLATLLQKETQPHVR
ncbi:hypothetical protein OQA88_7108 [Cercophora sp. LCS_1]